MTGEQGITTDNVPTGVTGTAVAVGIDVGGTKLLAVSLTADGEVIERRREDSTDLDSDGLVATIADLARTLGPDLPTGVGIAGIVSRDGVIARSPNLPIEGLPLRALLEDELRQQVVVDNDANVALVGEHRLGAAAGADDVIMLTLGTGVGGGILLDGTLVHGANGYAGELGHMIVREGGRPCPCGARGCLEVYASGTAIALSARERLATGGDHTLLSGYPTLTGKVVTRAALDGDRVAQDVLTDTGRWVGIGLVGLVNALDPEVIVIGGGATSGAARWLLPAARETMAQLVLGSEDRRLPEVREAELGDDAGAVGAGLLVVPTP